MKRLLLLWMLVLMLSCVHAWAHTSSKGDDGYLLTNYDSSDSSHATLFDPNSPRSVNLGSTNSEWHAASHLLTPSPSPQPGDSRSYNENDNIIYSYEASPLKLNVVTPLLSVVGSVQLGSRDSAQISFQIDPTNPMKDTEHLWDSRGRAILVPGTLTCKINYTTTLVEDEQAGLTLGFQGTANGNFASLGAGPNWEKFDGNSFTETKTCVLGEVPAYTTTAELQKKCLPCYRRVRKTLSDDTHARAKALSYLVNTNLCKSDSECTQENGAWSVGRCTLVVDKNGSHITECHSKSRIGGSCPGEGSSRLFEYGCDKGLKCVLVHKGTGFSWSATDYNRYECRDPKHPQWTQSPSLD